MKKFSFVILALLLLCTSCTSYTSYKTNVASFENTFIAEPENNDFITNIEFVDEPMFDLNIQCIRLNMICTMKSDISNISQQDIYYINNDGTIDQVVYDDYNYVEKFDNNQIRIVLDCPAIKFTKETIDGKLAYVKTISNKLLINGSECTANINFKVIYEKFNKIESDTLYIRNFSASEIDALIEKTR